MSKTDCRNVRRELEDAATGELLSAPARAHLSNCASCSTFGDEQQKLKEMVASLGTIEAPADFDFKLRARLAASRSSRRDLLSGNGFGMRSIAVATLVLLFGVIVILVTVRSPSVESVQNNQPTQTIKKEQPSERSGAPIEVAATSPAQAANSVDLQRSPSIRNVTRRSGSSMSQYASARSGRVRATDLSAMAAPVWRPAETALGSSVFPLGASYQPLKVSVDDGRGSSRTISLPRVSFGSSRVLARNPAPVMASMRDSW